MFKSFLFSICFFSLLSCQGQDHQQDSTAQSDSIRARPERTISFSGYEWTVRNTNGKQGPGPNYFRDSSISVDNKGYLHLWIKKNPATGRWECAEITSKLSFEYGTYQFVVEGPIDKFDKNIVLGLFNYSGNNGLDEMDIEIAR